MNSSEHDTGRSAGAGPLSGSELAGSMKALIDGLGSWAAAASSGLDAEGRQAGHPGGQPGESSGGGGFAGGPHGWTDATAPPHHISTCGVCPVCLGLAAMARSHPDVLRHLGDAAASVLAAVATFSQSAGEQQPGARAGSGRPAGDRPSTGRPSTGRPSTGRPGSGPTGSDPDPESPGWPESEATTREPPEERIDVSD